MRIDVSAFIREEKAWLLERYRSLLKMAYRYLLSNMAKVNYRQYLFFQTHFILNRENEQINLNETSVLRSHFMDNEIFSLLKMWDTEEYVLFNSLAIDVLNHRLSIHFQSRPRLQGIEYQTYILSTITALSELDNALNEFFIESAHSQILIPFIENHTDFYLIDIRVHTSSSCTHVVSRVHGKTSSLSEQLHRTLQNSLSPFRNPRFHQKKGCRFDCSPEMSDLALFFQMQSILNGEKKEALVLAREHRLFYLMWIEHFMGNINFLKMYQETYIAPLLISLFEQLKKSHLAPVVNWFDLPSWLSTAGLISPHSYLIERFFDMYESTLVKNKFEDYGLEYLKHLYYSTLSQMYVWLEPYFTPESHPIKLLENFLDPRNVARLIGFSYEFYQIYQNPAKLSALSRTLVYLAGMHFLFKKEFNLKQVVGSYFLKALFSTAETAWAYYADFHQPRQFQKSNETLVNHRFAYSHFMENLRLHFFSHTSWLTFQGQKFLFYIVYELLFQKMSTENRRGLLAATELVFYYRDWNLANYILSYLNHLSFADDFMQSKHAKEIIAEIETAAAKLLNQSHNTSLEVTSFNGTHLSCHVLFENEKTMQDHRINITIEPIQNQWACVHVLSHGKLTFWHQKRTIAQEDVTPHVAQRCLGQKWFTPNPVEETPEATSFFRPPLSLQ